MAGKFNLYDFIAVVIPGLLFLWVMSMLADQFGITISIPFSGGIGETSVLVALSYVMGLLLQGVSQGITEKILLWVWGGFPSARWLLPEDTRLSTEYKNKIFRVVQQKFDISMNGVGKDLPPKEKRSALIKKNQEIFYICYSAVEKEKISDKPQIFNAQYGLFRCLLTAFLIIAVVDLSMIISSDISRNKFLLIILVFSIVGLVLSYLRIQKRAEDFAKSIYDLFLVHYGT